MAHHLHIDFETYSACELADRGLDNYANDPSTGAHCLAGAFDDGPIWCLPIGVGTHAVSEPEVSRHVRNGGLVVAHNAAFEWAIWNRIMVPRFGWPELKIEQVRCTMAMGYAMGLPGKLENMAPALGIELRKDMIGKRIMLKWCKPKPDGSFWTPSDDPEQFEALCRYCEQDVRVERAMHARLMELSPIEQELWQLDHRINQRGVMVDLGAIDKALKLVGQECARLDAEMLRVTSGAVGSCTEVQLLVKWIRAQGVALKGVAKADLLDALALDSLPRPVRRALELRKERAKTSTAKFVAMRDRASLDGRVRSIHQFHGAGTGRWAGRGIQPQNMARPRPGIKPGHVDDILAHLDDRDYIDLFYGPVMDALADCVRGVIVPPKGKDFIAMDFSAIEARMLAWLAGQESVLDVFRGHGKIYEHAAAGIYHVPIDQVDKNQRQIGKVAVLALGYGGGVGAFQSMAKVYGVKVPDAEAEEIKVAWRREHGAIVSYWYALESAAISAVEEGGIWKVGPAGRQIAYRKNGSFLWCRLPSGRVLCYPYPEIRLVTTPWGEEKAALTYMTVVDPSRKLKVLDDPNSNGTWKRISTYGGSLAENVTQAAARDLLRDAMFRLEAADYPIVMHIHDEVVVEIETECDDRTLGHVERLMATVPDWAKGLPLSADGWRGKRYRK